MKKIILSLLFLLLLVGCTSSNEIKVDIASQTIKSVGGNLKSVTILSQDGEILADYSLWNDSMSDVISIPLIKLPPYEYVSITNSGGDRARYTIFVITDSQGKVAKELEQDEVPDTIKRLRRR